MDDIKIFIAILISTWLLGSVFYYGYMYSKVKLPIQKVVLFIIGGPLIWIVLPLFFILEKLAETVFESLHNWLTKE